MNMTADEKIDIKAVEQCLAEIAAESDILQHIESPYVRLAIAWGGALVTSIRSTGKSNERKQNKRCPAPRALPRRAPVAVLWPLGTL